MLFVNLKHFFFLSPVGSATICESPRSLFYIGIVLCACCHLIPFFLSPFSSQITHEQFVAFL